MTGPATEFDQTIEGDHASLEIQDSTVEIARHVLILLAAFVLWIWSVNRVDQSALGDYGLIAILPVTTFVSLLIAIIGFALATQREKPGPLLATYTMALAVMLHGIPTFAYDYLRSSWAWKHVGVVEYIQRFGDVNPNGGTLAVYHNWPGFFGLNAWITDSSGLGSALSYAAWAPIVFNLMFIGALYMMFRAFTANQNLIWTSIVIFILGSWVGQDYFAPQAIAFFMYLLLMGILMRWYSRSISDAAELVDDGFEPGTASARILAGVMVLAMVMIASSHQLTPIVTIAAIGALVIFKQLRVKWPLWAMIAITAIWFFGPARDFIFSHAQNVIREFGGVSSNLDSTVVDYGTATAAQRSISLISRSLSAIIFVLAGVGLIRRRAVGHRSGWLLVLAAVPAVLVFVSSYRGEIILRAYLFALPFAAFLAASVWFPKNVRKGQSPSPIVLGVVLATLIPALLLADFGADRRQVFSETEVVAAEYVMTNIDTYSLIIEGTRDYPRLYRNTEDGTYLTIDRLPTQALEHVLSDPAGVLHRWLSDTTRYTGGFIIITDSQRASVSTLGKSLAPALDEIEASLRASDLFTIGYDAPDAVVFVPVEQP